MGEAIPEPMSEWIRVFIGAPALVFAVGFVIGAIEIAGVIDMAMAHLLMTFAWVVSVFSVVLESKYEPKRKLALVGIVTVVLVGFDYWMVKERAELDIYGQGSEGIFAILEN